MKKILLIIFVAFMMTSNAQNYFSSREGLKALKQKLHELNTITDGLYIFKFSHQDQIKIKDVVNKKTYYISLSNISIINSQVDSTRLTLNSRGTAEYYDNVKNWRKIGGISKPIIGYTVAIALSTLKIDLKNNQPTQVWSILSPLCDDAHRFYCKPNKIKK